MPFRLLSSTNSTPPFLGTVTALPGRRCRQVVEQRQVDGLAQGGDAQGALGVEHHAAVGPVPPLTVTGRRTPGAAVLHHELALGEGDPPAASANTGSAGATRSRCGQTGIRP